MGLLTDPSIPNVEGQEDCVGLSRFEIPSYPECRLVSINDQQSIGAERLRTLAARLRQAQHRHSLRKLLITSAVPGEGKTLMSANLAITLALHRQRTLIIDGDFRKPSLAGVLDVGNRNGLADWWERKDSISASLLQAEGLPLWFLPAGREPHSPASILQSAEIADLLKQLSMQFDWILIDSPPLTPFADAATWATLSDAIVLVARQATTPKKVLQDALKSIDTKKVIAKLLNDSKVSDENYYHHYYQKPKQPAERVTQLHVSSPSGK